MLVAPWNGGVWTFYSGQVLEIPLLALRLHNSVLFAG